MEYRRPGRRSLKASATMAEMLELGPASDREGSLYVGL